MHPTEENARNGHNVQQAQSDTYAAIDSKGQPIRAGTISICNVDLPIAIASGEVYVQATLQEFFDALSAAMVELLRDLEIGISETRRATLASAHLFPEVHIEGVAEPNVVRDRRVE